MPKGESSRASRSDTSHHALARPAGALAAIEPLWLHIGGEEVKAGWKILNIQAKPGVDFVGSATDLSDFADGSAERIYASHIYEHLNYGDEVTVAFAHAHRVLAPGGQLFVAVPNLEVLCQAMIHPETTTEGQFHLQRMIYGGHIDAYDYHHAGFTPGLLASYLHGVGFHHVAQVESFGLFMDTSELRVGPFPISLNVIATKAPPAGKPGATGSAR